MRPTWNALFNKIKRGNSVESSRFFVFDGSKAKINKVFFLFMSFGLVGVMCGSTNGQQAKNIINLDSAIKCKTIFSWGEENSDC
jgi:hypothetical protein